MIDVAILVPEPSVAMSAVLITDLCWVAALYAEQDPTDKIRVIGLSGDPVPSFSGLDVAVNGSLADVEEASLLFISAFWGSSGRALDRNAEALGWIERLASAGTRVAACSTGTFLLAATGLLDGRVATTYAPYAKTFRRRFPAVLLHPERAITDAGELMCADAIPSSLDLIIACLGDLHGPDVARRLAADFLMGIRRSYTVANLAFDGQKYHGDRTILAVQRWFERHLDEPIRVQDAARQFGLSSRTLSRRFAAATGEAPSLYLQRLRIESAKSLLAQPGMTVGEVARAVGYVDVASFSATFRRREGVVPSLYGLSEH
ncbi:MAG: helix-turn-helix domain-containing protein [Actinomycetia bacterium]|nr:helix-turn-helix domain-containing protein [Actinomycetes bacterium]MCP4962340.1 helix-turn-helix domain-containing protein [Actinomycetes bacterium]